VIGFKAVDNMGRSVDFSGVLVGGGLERMVSTVHDGMGSFEFLPEAGESYGIRDASGKVHPLPAPAEEGAAINLWSAAGRYYINTIGFGGGEASLLVRDNSRLRPLAQLTMDGEMSLMMVRMSSFSPGINHLLIVNSHGQILAERLFYVRDKAEPLCLCLAEPVDWITYRRLPSMIGRVCTDVIMEDSPRLPSHRTGKRHGESLIHVWALMSISVQQRDISSCYPPWQQHSIT
jgi:hypothetical protein